MTYRSLDEIYADKAEALSEIEGMLRPLTPAQLGFHATPGAWSIAEIAEHLAIVETGQLRMLGALIEKAELGGRGPAPVSVELDERYRDSANGRIQTRDQLKPTGTVPAPASLESLRRLQAGLFDLRPRLDRVDIGAVRFQHAVLGDLTLGQWVAFVGVHEERHLRQMRGVMASPAFPRG